MKELTVQIKRKVLYPFSPEDQDELAGYHDNQVVRVKVYGTEKQRSLKQLRKYFATCTKVAENIDDFQWNTKNKVDFQCRVALHFVDDTVSAVRPDGTVIFSYRSISYDNLKHIDACRYFSRSYDIMSAKLRITTEKLLEYVKD